MSPTLDASPTIGLVFPGDSRLPSTRSGVPYSLSRGFEAAGVAVRHLSAEPGPAGRWLVLRGLGALHLPRAVRRGSLDVCRAAAFNGPQLGTVQTAIARRRVRHAGELAGFIQIGSSYALPPGVRYVTHDDMTVVQAARAGYPGMAALRPGAVAARIERQRQAFEHAVACCVTTRWAARSVVEDYGIASEKVHVVGGGRNREPLVVERDWARPRFLFVGKDWERKNGPTVLRAFARLRDDVPEARLDVVGNHPPITAPGVTAHGPLRLDIPEERARLDELFAAATCFVMPSRHEPSGIVFSEANAAGIPSIGTTEGGSGELIGDAGVIVHPDDESGLTAAMRELAEPGTAERLSRRARARSRLFTWPAVAERVLRALAPEGVERDSLAEFLHLTPSRRMP